MGAGIPRQRTTLIPLVVSAVLRDGVQGKDLYSRGGTLLTPAVGDYVAWRCRFASTVNAVYGYRVGGTGATVNAIRRRAGANVDLLASDLSLTSADGWLAGGSPQNTGWAIGDALLISVRSIAGAPTQAGIQVDLTKA